MTNDSRCELTRDCPRPADQVVVTVNGWVVDCCGPCAVAACDHIQASMGFDDLSAFMREQSAESPEYRESLASLIAAERSAAGGA